MPTLDLDKGGYAPGLEVCDICLVGSGPAGSVLARELSGTALRITLLESGGTARSDAADALNEVENVGYPRIADQWFVRNRILGGSSHTWGGRCAPFDDEDLEARSWVPRSGWPLRIDDIAPFLDRSATHLGLAAGRWSSDARFWATTKREAPGPLPDARLLRPFLWQYSRDAGEAYRYEYARFGRHLTELVGENVTVVSAATVLRIDPVPSGDAVRCVVFAGPDGRRRVLAAPTVVLCSGGIENARLLLSSDTVTPGGLGNDRDLVGRYFMDHLRGSVGAFAVADAALLQRRLGRYNVHGHLFRAGLRLSPEIQRNEALLNAAVWLGEEVAPDDPWNALRRLRKGEPGRMADIGTVLSNTRLVARGIEIYLVARNGVPRKYAGLTLDGMCEQLPDRDSRVTLSDRRDRFDMLLPRIDWRIHADEARTLRRVAQLVMEESARMELPAPVLADWVRDGGDIPTSFTDVAHPTGTTRMASSPAHGVVDAACQVHGVSGLYVTGSSVFPTAGHCNPTQMIVALAIRLADHLKEKAALRDRAVVLSQRAATRTIAAEARTRVLVTGATGRIGRVVVADLLERGYLVRATTSKSLSVTARVADTVEWHHFDLQEAGDYDGLVAGCGAVLHIAAEMAEPARMDRANVEATGLLAAAAERAGVRVFCYTSSIAVYGSGRSRTAAEDAPVLTVDRDIPSEYWAVDQTRAYGRTKLGGEHALHRSARSVRYVVVRPAVVVSVAQIIEIRDWSPIKRALTAHRHAHQVYVGDVSDAILWLMERALAGAGAPGGVETFNISEDEFEEPTHADFLRKALAASGDRRFRVLPVPWIADWLRDFLRFRRSPLRHPGWRMRFPNDRLRAAGYRFRFGMAKAQNLAVAALRDESASPRPIGE
ncbi:GMC family oxidoreductase [Methylobacterium sp. J-090]|uniref:GMC family oxidoreductase n=1 Tax=Methylobacterium sp. J-090 TaxID=2836666 RepID=UPI001FB9F37D|nr:GMC family oxidoreductase [Methylobacterium sp. J-090]MCJ2082820.1 GMC family oxidoreductase [Methylobacterium sp. J-090]